MSENRPTTFICSYPKSGRTWLAWFIANYFNLSARLGLEIDFQTLYQLIPADGSPAEPHAARVAGRIPPIRQSHNPRDPRAEPFRHVIFLVRDPLDTLVSQYFHESRQWQKEVGTLRDFVRAQAAEWVAYMNVWMERLPNIRSMVLAYEARLRDREAYLADVLRFLGVAEVDPAMLDEAIRRSEFSAMLAKELAGPANPGHRYDVRDVEARRVRKGKAGAWRDHLDEADAAAVRQCIRASGSAALHAFMQRYGYAP